MLKSTLRYIPFVFSGFLLILFSCNNKKETECHEEDVYSKENWKKIPNKYAQNYVLEQNYFTDEFKLTFLNPWDGELYQELLLPSDDSVKSDKTIIALMGAQIGFISALNKQESIVGVGNIKYVYDSIVYDNYKKNKVKEYGSLDQLNNELLLADSNSIVLSSGFAGSLESLDDILKKNKTFILTLEWTEKHPLARAEWIKVFGAILGEYKLADSLFNVTENSYQSLVKESNSSKSILFGSMYGDVWYQPAKNSFKTIFVKDAGLNYVFHEKENNNEPSLALNFETVLSQQRNADIWFIESSFSSLKELKDKNDLYQQFKAFQTKNVFDISNQKRKNGGEAYWENSIVYPDRLLNDLILISKNPNSKNLTYLKKIE